MPLLIMAGLGFVASAENVDVLKLRLKVGLPGYDPFSLLQTILKT